MAIRTTVAACALALGLVRPALACCQLGGTTCGDPFAIECNNGAVCFPPWRTCPSCTCTSTSSGRTCLANASVPGTVSTLLVGKSGTPGDLDLSWTPSCNPSTLDYAIDEGAIGTWYSHEARKCTGAGILMTTLTPFGGNRYYLVAPVIGSFTGSLGASSTGAERPDGAPSCTADRAVAPCP
jgi:hypothetical protein